MVSPVSLAPLGRLDGGLGASDRRPWLLAVLSLCFACVALDNSKLALAMPTVLRELGAGSFGSRWLVEANLIVYASLLLCGGALSERFGARRVLLLGLALFGAGSAAAAVESSTAGLLVSRALVGVGAALITPATLATIKHGFTPQERPRAIAIWTGSFGAAAALGPLLGGVLLERWGWRSIMLGNLPPAALGAMGALALVPADLPRRAAPLDPLGTLLGFGASAALLLSILGGMGAGWSALALAAGSGLYALLFVWERRAPHPMLDPQLFRAPRFRATLCVIVLAYFSFSGLGFVALQFLQIGRGHAPSAASLLNLPLPLAMLAGTLLAPRLMQRSGAAQALRSSLLLAALGAALVGLGSWTESDVLLCVALVPFALGSGGAFVNATETILSSVPEQRAGTAAAISETAFELGGVLGIALLGTCFGAFTSASGASGGASAAAFLAALVLAAASQLGARLRHPASE